MKIKIPVLLGSSILATSLGAVSAISGIGVQSAEAALIRIPSTSLPGAGNNENDCSGYFGQGFSNCNITGPTGTEFSPVIIKFNTADEEKPASLEINNALYPTINGSEWTFNPADGIFPDDAGTGTWTYTPGTDDPGIRYWVAKGGNRGFNLFFEVPDTAVAPGGACVAGQEYTDACLDLAEVVTSGTWLTPLNSRGNRPGLSHITFYNTGDDGGGGGPTVPEPSAVMGLAALAGAGFLRRRKSS